MNKTIKSVLSAFFSLFFSAILSFILFGMTDIADCEIFTASLIFNCIGFIIMFAAFTFGSVLSSLITVPMQISLDITAVLYVIVNFAVSLISKDIMSVKTYLLINMIVLFVYLLVITIITIVGSNNIKK